MFGIIVCGRMVETDFKQVGERHFLSVIQDADNVNHIVIFMTGQVPFPDGTIGLIYLNWPDPVAPPSWQVIGYISNDKPSSVFKVSGLKKKIVGHSVRLQYRPKGKSQNAEIGIFVEPANKVQQQLSKLETSKPNLQSQFVEFSQKMLQNFVNYATSFTTTQAQMVPNPTENYVPLAVIQNWYQHFERRLTMNPYFWQS